MSELLSSDSDATTSGGTAGESEERDLQTLWLDSEEAGDLLSSLASDTARSVLTALHDEPATASEVADRVDTSLQNARHHLSNLQDADLVEVTDTRYSSKGREMDVYAPSQDPTVVFVGSRENDGGLLDSLRRLVPVLAVLAVVSALVEWFVVPNIGTTAAGELPRLGDGVGGGAAPLALPVGAIFLAGGLLAVGLVLAVSRWQSTT